MRTSGDLYKLFIEKVFDPDTIELKEFFKSALLNPACNIMGFTLMDHLIIAPEKYYSYTEEERL